MVSAWRHRDVHRQLVAGVLWQPGLKSLPVVLVDHHIAGGNRLKIIHLPASLHRCCGRIAAAAGVLICQLVSCDRADYSSACRSRNFAVASPDGAAEQGARHPADEGSCLGMLGGVY